LEKNHIGGFQDLFQDTLTNLPHHVLLLPMLEKHLRNDSCLGLIVVSLNDLDPIEEAFGSEVHNQIIRQVSQSLFSFKGSIIRDNDLLAVSELGGSSFMIFLTAREGATKKKHLSRSDVEAIGERVKENLFSRLIPILGRYYKGLPKLSVGHSFVVYNRLVRKRRLINRLIEEAHEVR